MGAYKYGEAKPLPRIAALVEADVELDGIRERKLAELAELRAEENQLRERLNRLRQATKKALSRHEIITTVSVKPFPQIVFTEPPGTGAQRMRELLREIDGHEFADPRLNRSGR